MMSELQEQRDAARRRVCEILVGQSYAQHLVWGDERVARFHEIACTEFSVGIANDLYGIPPEHPDIALARELATFEAQP